MAKETGLLQYLKELREEVCNHCAAQHATDSACETSSTPCGLELPLAQLIEAIDRPHEKGEKKDLPQVDPKAGHCPCPPDVLARFAEEASQAIENRRKQRERLLETWNDG